MQMMILMLLDGRLKKQFLKNCQRLQETGNGYILCDEEHLMTGNLKTIWGLFLFYMPLSELIRHAYGFRLACKLTMRRDLPVASSVHEQFTKLVEIQLPSYPS